MSRGRPFAVWLHPSASGRPTLSIHPVGYIPGGAEAVSPPLPLGFADALKLFLQEEMARAPRCGLLGRWRGPAARLRRQALRIVGRRFELEVSPGAFADAEREAREPILPGTRLGAVASAVSGRDFLVEHAGEILQGRALFTDELYAALRERGIHAYAPLDLLLDGPVREGRIERLPGVAWLGESWECSRCGSREIGFYPCLRCGLSRCPQCIECRSLGASTGCAALYHRPLPGEAPRPGIRISLPFPLSSRQEQLADALEKLEESAFVWAACGAGKTEVTLKAIAHVLRSGGRALFAVPRRDVADQLARRLQAAVQGAEVVLLSGETPERYADAPLIVATVHQALRFRGAFRLIVVDEVDAYPLSVEAWLMRGLARAAHPEGRAIAMSATPPDATRRLFGAALRCFTLPARHHGHPLPEPEVWVDAGLDGVGREAPREGEPWLGRLVEHARRTCAAGRKLLIFVPYVRWSLALPQLLLERGGFSPWACGGRARPARGDPEATGLRGRRLVVTGVHAQDRERRAKVRSMEAGEIDVLVSTSLLERGVTIARLDVLVFAAHCERVYDSAALVQMAGRAGRKQEDPTGRVIFWGARETPAMREAAASIAALNRQAQAEGLLHGKEVG